MISLRIHDELGNSVEVMDLNYIEVERLIDLVGKEAMSVVINDLNIDSWGCYPAINIKPVDELKLGELYFVRPLLGRGEVYGQDGVKFLGQSRLSNFNINMGHGFDDNNWGDLSYSQVKQSLAQYKEVYESEEAFDDED